MRLNFSRVTIHSGAALLLALPVVSASAQDRRATEEMLARVRPRLEAAGMPELLSFMRADPKRAMLGVTTQTGAAGDTLGILITDVTAGGPADKAGIKANSRITAINGVSMKVSASDANDPEMQDVLQRRLQRELGKLTVGDEVEVRLANGSSTQTVRIKTVSAADLEPARGAMNSGPYVRTIRGDDKRASLGVSIGSTGSVRDTLGIFISSVVTAGPAEKAGIFEGDRIAAINGVDVRVPREDAEDMQSAMARVNRFTREVQKLAPGDKATLRVFGGGRYREVQVTLGNAAELRGNNFMFNFGDGMGEMTRPGIRTLQPPSGTIRRVSPGTIRRGAGN